VGAEIKPSSLSEKLTLVLLELRTYAVAATLSSAVTIYTRNSHVVTLKAQSLGDRGGGKSCWISDLNLKYLI
jgi:hypothetical protein